MRRSRLEVDLVLTYMLIAFTDVLVVAGIFYQTNSWELVSLWHTSMYLYAVFIGYILSFYYRSFVPAVALFNYFYFQVEDILYMIFSTLLGWEPKPWIDPLYRWTWLDHTLSGYISRLLGFEGATTLGVILTSLVGLVLTVVVCRRLRRI